MLESDFGNRQEYYTNNVIYGEFGGEIETGDNPIFEKYVLDCTLMDLLSGFDWKNKNYLKAKHDIKINEEDYRYYLNYVFYDL